MDLKKYWYNNVHTRPLCLISVFNAFPHIDAFRRHLQQTTFWKHCDKRWNCSRRAISPFATMFSTLLNYYTFINRDVSNLSALYFKVVCRRYVVWGKGLTLYLIPTRSPTSDAAGVFWSKQFLVFSQCFQLFIKNIHTDFSFL